MFKFLYNLFVFIYPKLIGFTSLWNAKAKQWVEGRREIISRLSESFQHNNHKIIWMHCASLGEFEQGRPVLEALKKKYPSYKILLTFFSPSGYENKKNYDGADFIYYLPMDSATNAKQFLDIVKPTLVIFVKYEFWFHYLMEANRRNIDTVLVSAIFFNQHIFFKWYGVLHRQMLDCFKVIFLQNEDSLPLLKAISPKSELVIAGDTRFDRVLNIMSNRLIINKIANFSLNNNLIIAGSTWSNDDTILSKMSNKDKKLKFIVAPHDISESRIVECSRLYQDAQLYSEWKNKPLLTTRVIIIDNIGLLSSLYQYATICFIGGGFDKEGIHNLLEAAVFSKPIIFGPVYSKYEEAKEIIKEEGGYSVDNLKNLELLVHKLINDPDFYSKTAERAGKFVLNHAGSTQIIIKKLETFSLN